MLAGILCIAWSAIFVRWTDMPGPASAFYRLLIPAIVLVPTWFFDRDKTRMDAKSLAIIAVGGLFFALDLAFYNTSILLTSAANATILGNNTPIFVGLLTWLVLRRPPSVTYWLGLALAMAGSLVIVRGDLLRHVRLGSGDAMALAASVCFGVYLLATERVRKTASTIGFLPDLAVGRLPGVDLCDGASAGDGYIGEFAFPGPAYRAACRAAAPRADDRSANPWRSAGAGGSGAGQPAEASVGRSKCYAVRGRRARINSKQIPGRTVYTLWRCAT